MRLLAAETFMSSFPCWTLAKLIPTVASLVHLQWVEVDPALSTAPVSFLLPTLGLGWYLSPVLDPSSPDTR